MHDIIKDKIALIVINFYFTWGRQKIELSHASIFPSHCHLKKSQMPPQSSSLLSIRSFNSFNPLFKELNDHLTGANDKSSQILSSKLKD
jgi:hypothetical protein